MQLKPLNIILFGPPGAGKSTQAKFLGDLTEIDSISTGQRLRATVEAQTALGKEVAEIMAKGGLVNDDLMARLVREWINEIPHDVGVLLDGYPRTIEQAQSLDDVLAEVKRPLDVVIALTLSDEEAVHRLSGRRICRIKGQPDTTIHIDNQAAIDACLAAGGTLIERADDNPETIKHRLEEYNHKTEPILHFYGERDVLILVDADGTPEEVAAAIKTALIERFAN